MDKCNFKTCLSSNERHLAAISFGEDGSVAVDQSPCGRANINPRTGFAYSDLQKVMLQQDLNERRRLLDNLPSFRAEFLDEKMSDEDAIRFMQPSNMQLPSEFASEVERRLDFDLKQRADRQRVEERHELLDFIAGERKEPKED